MSIIGNGDIANVLNDRRQALFFAAGVSNSSCVSQYQFNREIRLLTEQPTDLCLFYFSSLSIYTKKSQYVEHKKQMEQIIRDRFENFNIIRIGNITWGDNPNTFINFFKRMIAHDKPFKIFNEYRYLISKEELLLLTDNLPLVGRNVINCCGRIVKVQDVVNELINEQNRVHTNHK